MARPTWSTQPLASNFAANEKMALRLGRILLTSKSLTLLKLPNMLRSLALTMNQLSTDGFLMSWGKEIVLFLLWENAICVTWNGPIKLASNCLRPSKKPLHLTRRMVIPSGLTPLPRRWRTLVLPSKSYLTGNLHQLATRRYPVIWYLTSKWKFFWHKARLPLKDKILIWQNILYRVLDMSTQYNILYHTTQYIVFNKKFIFFIHNSLYCHYKKIILSNKLQLF